MSSLIGYITDDLDFLSFLAERVPRAQPVLMQYVHSPNCSACIDRLGQLDKELLPMHDGLVEEFTKKYNRPPRSKQNVHIRPLLVGDFTVNPSTYREFIREMARNHRWNTMQNVPQKDGTWRLTFS
jgi:hypothetical protein